MKIQVCPTFNCVISMLGNQMEILENLSTLVWCVIEQRHTNTRTLGCEIVIDFLQILRQFRLSGKGIDKKVDI